MWWLVLAASLATLTVIGAWLSQRFGRGAYETTFKHPENEIQTTTQFQSHWP